MSSGSESDEEYVPGEPEVVSEEDSADEETEKQYENEQDIKSKKRKAATKKGNKKRKSKPAKETEKETTPDPEVVDPEAEKKREDDLWAMFLDGTDTKPKPKEDKKASTKDIETPKLTSQKPQSSSSSQKQDEDREKRIFEFAGETIVVENNVIKEKYKAGEGPTDVTKLALSKPRGRTSAGLSGVLGQLNKKTQLSTLDKSKLDWETLKQKEGVEEEIKSHNKGKEGFLERQDFLQRADLRQYEIERDARLSRRSNR